VKLQLQRMHHYYGIDITNICGTCQNFVTGKYHNRILRKCERYGVTHSEASDWARSWYACGMHNVPLLDGERPLIEYCDRSRTQIIETIPGQISLVDLEPGREKE
jgi:hypothetical protein